MYLDVFDRNPYGTNCWLLAQEDSDEAVVVDPGFEPDRVHALLSAAGRKPAAVILTHAHADHAGAAGAFAGDLPVWVHTEDALAFEDHERWAPGYPMALDPVKDLRTFDDGDALTTAGLRLVAIHTPGHTPGSSCFRIEGEGVVLSGDLVFAGTIGRSDFSNSDPEAMRRSLSRFLGLPDELEVLPGHGPRTTVERERATNPFLQGIG
jgi:glyoxylase-like metal-dependent hydrolase (beta-lactamase superfamily II)